MLVFILFLSFPLFFQIFYDEQYYFDKFEKGKVIPLKKWA